MNSESSLGERDYILESYYVNNRKVDNFSDYTVLHHWNDIWPTDDRESCLMPRCDSSRLEIYRHTVGKLDFLIE